MSSWSLNNWGKNGSNPADEFLNPQEGSDSLYSAVPDDTRTSDGKEAAQLKPCLSNGDCGSGFSCIGGWCTNPYNDRGASNPGDCGPDKPNTPCKETFRKECSQPGSNCYYDKLKSDCCGNRSCARTGAGEVSCRCDDDSSRQKQCNKFCTNYAQANGENGPGCSEGITCSECYTCTEVGTSPENRIPICQSKDSSQGPPCWCSAGGNCSSGKACSKSTGQCEDSNNKTYCYTSLNFSCNGGGNSYNVKVCRPTAASAQKAYNAELKNLCNKENTDADVGTKEDPCRGDCKSITTEGGGFSCPPNSTCRTSGSISGGGKQYTITEVCDKSQVPDSCKDCDCNCNNDCGPCQICGERGVCTPDPGCENCGKDEEAGGGASFPKKRMVGAWAPYNTRVSSGGGGTSYGLCTTESTPGEYNSLIYYCGVGLTTHIQYSVPSKMKVELVTIGEGNSSLGGCNTGKLPEGACAQGLPNANQRYYMSFDGSDPNPCTSVLYNRTNSALTSSSFTYTCSMWSSSVPRLISSPAFCDISELEEFFNIPPGEEYTVYGQYSGRYG